MSIALAPEGSSMSTANYQALLVDDYPAIRKLMDRALKLEGFICTHANDGNEAAGLVRDQAFDLVITDLKMPACNGHSLATEVLESPNRPALVIFTGIVDPTLAKDLMSRGVDDIVLKPIDFGVLAVRMKTLVDRRKAASAKRDSKKTSSYSNLTSPANAGGVPVQA
jgi:DNA-binding response OmpR family regulator